MNNKRRRRKKTRGWYRLRDKTYSFGKIVWVRMAWPLCSELAPMTGGSENLGGKMWFRTVMPFVFAFSVHNPVATTDS